MRKIGTFLLALAVLVSLTLTCSAEAYSVNYGGVTVTENADSITGYTATFTYENAEATNVRLVGSFMFYVENDPNCYSNGWNLAEGDSVQNYIVKPQNWSKDADLWHVFDESVTGDMVHDEETGAWTYSLDLPGGYYLYKFGVSTDNGESYTNITDPLNIPYVNELGANQDRSQFYVPYNAEKQNAENDDWSWTTPAENEEDRGTLLSGTYMGINDVERPYMIYLPANYDAEREEPYKVVYLSHGWGGDQGDWMYQAHAGNIMDRLAAAGECEEFIIVTMNNSHDFDWEFEPIVRNTKDYLIPHIEANYNVSTEPAGRAFGGMSMGGMTTHKMQFDDPDYFGYYGMMSGSRVREFPELEDYSEYHIPSMFIAAGFEDHAIEDRVNFGGITSVQAAEKLDELGIPYIGVHVVQGGHDWFTWPQILRDWIRIALWK